ncbi:DMT family transporter [Neptuniibacter halophilus]|uniref:DMT family transporter n=1 Tax=Neptuniibacter halophilus TaxID=651666 RepID=UPI002573EEDF|nr:DMT family transporter [Neptuniibacter halophilus]
METQQIRGIIYMLLAMLLISVQEALAKYLGERLPVGQVVWARYVGHLFLIFCWLWPRYGRSLIRAVQHRVQIGRSLILLLDTLLFFYGLTLLGLAEATAIFFTVPLLVLLLSVPLLGERVTGGALLAILIGFAGTLIIVRPGGSATLDSTALSGALCIFGSACCAALYNVTTRKLAEQDPVQVTLFFTALVGTLATTLYVPFIWVTPTGTLVWLALTCIGFFGGMAHSLMIIAHKHARATALAPFMYSQIIWALALGWLLFNELPDKLAWLGGSIVILSGLYLFWQDWRRVRKQHA